MTDSHQDMPRTFTRFTERFPALHGIHESIARFVDQAGPLDRRECELIKMGICMGAGLESAFRSPVRRALEHGATTVEIERDRAQ